MKLLKSVSQWAREVFYLPSITQATAQMLNFVIMSLVGPKSLQLQVSNPEKLAFKPISILQDVILMLTSLGSNEDFSNALVQDERSFKIQYYQKAMRILRKQRIIHCLPNFQALIQLLCQKDTGQQELLGDPPEQFVCPLSCDLMKEPVFVKTCQKICEKAFIKRIILNDGKDPYNRMPLSEQDLEDCVELKARIQKWIKQKLAGQVTDEDLRIQQESQEQASNVDQREDVKMQVEGSAFDDDYEENYNGGNQGANQFGMMNNQFPNFNDDEMDEDMLLALQLSMNDNNNHGK